METNKREISVMELERWFANQPEEVRLEINRRVQFEQNDGVPEMRYDTQRRCIREAMLKAEQSRPTDSEAVKTPAGFRPVKVQILRSGDFEPTEVVAFFSGKQIVIQEQASMPLPNTDDLPEDQWHNCDQMGCGGPVSGHVVMRIWLEGL